jgi:hypothetical protein
MTDERAELLDAILHRGAGEIDSTVGTVHPFLHGGRPLRRRVLDVVRLVDDERVGRTTLLLVEGYCGDRDRPLVTQLVEPPDDEE